MSGERRADPATRCVTFGNESVEEVSHVCALSRNSARPRFWATPIVIEGKGVTHLTYLLHPTARFVLGTDG